MREGVRKGRAIPVQEKFLVKLLMKAILYELSKEYKLEELPSEEEFEVYAEDLLKDTKLEGLPSKEEIRGYVEKISKDKDTCRH